MTPIPFQPLQHEPAPGSPPLPAHDPRWTLAARVTLLAGTRGLAPPVREQLIAAARAHAFSPIHAAAVIAIAEAAALRGGLDARAAEELASVPLPVRPEARRPAIFVAVALPTLAIIAAALYVLRGL